MKKKVRAIGLISGGLDSILAVKVIQSQGIKVTGLCFTCPFFGSQHAKAAAKGLNIPLIVKDFTEDHFLIVKNPPHGYGKTMNPCIDCHALMLKIAGQLMENKGFDFIFTGEVLNERPLSQNRQSLHVVANTSGYEKYIVRPLSAKLLDETEPEKKGLLNRQALLDIQGRSRKRQISLAQEFDIKEYPNPAGGCLLTDRAFSNRLKELLEHNVDPAYFELQLLRFGRHFRVSSHSKLVVGRDELENGIIEKFIIEGSFLFRTDEVPGPVCLLVGPDAKEHLDAAACICANYSDTKDKTECKVMCEQADKYREITVITDKAFREKGRIN
ncbi:MAG: tRNA 4-thiouridine(8) synthase ThiI [Candidatus Omnitrophica bacterium]|nr:tRNA 4-thiouridine(8) synthase ThiI [Candidatus Omnitrophota bacterium]